jgi:tetratricopeptide (TPR) repeat protein
MSKVAAKILVISFLAVLFFPVLGLGQEEGEEMAQLAGKVLDLEKKPIAQAEIQLKHQGTGQALSIKTNKKGEFTFRRLFPGKYSLTSVKEGYKSIYQELELEAGASRMVEIDLAREPSEEQKKRQEALALFQNGVSLAQADKLEEALDAFRKAVELKPDLAEAHINLGLLLYRQGKADEAEKALLKALELKPEESKTKEALADIYFEKAKELLQLDKIDEALEKLKLSSGFNPNYPFTNYLLGYAYTQKGMKEEAIKSFEAFLLLEPNAPQAAKVKEILENLKKQK